MHQEGGAQLEAERQREIESRPQLHELRPSRRCGGARLPEQLELDRYHLGLFFVVVLLLLLLLLVLLVELSGASGQGEGCSKAAEGRTTAL